MEVTQRISRIGETALTILGAQLLWMKERITSYWKNPGLHFEESQVQVS